MTRRQGHCWRRDGWIYGTDSACGLSFKLRDDGRDFSLLKISSDPPPVFTGFDARGNLLGGGPHQLFSFSIAAGTFSVLATDAASELSNVEAGPDGALYYLSNVATSAGAKNNGAAAFTTTVMRIVPGTGAPRVNQQINGGSMILGPLSRLPDGRLLGVLKTVEQYKRAVPAIVPVVGTSGMEISIFDDQPPLHLIAPMLMGSDGRMYGISSSNQLAKVFSITPDRRRTKNHLPGKPYDAIDLGNPGTMLTTGLILHADGILYGVMPGGGEGGQGTLYHVLTAEQLKQLAKTR